MIKPTIIKMKDGSYALTLQIAEEHFKTIMKDITLKQAQELASKVVEIHDRAVDATIDAMRQTKSELTVSREAYDLIDGAPIIDRWSK